MRSFRVDLFVLALTLPFAEGVVGQECRSVLYEPEQVTLKGKVVTGRAKHLNGSWWRIAVLKLERPVTVEPSSQADPVNGREACVREVQLTSSDRALHERLLKSRSKTMEVNGTLFHEHTAWHVRKIVMNVESVQTRNTRSGQ